MHLQPLEAFRSDPLFEPNTIIYSFWTLESLTGVYLPIGVRRHTTSNHNNHLSVSQAAQTVAPPAALYLAGPRLQARAFPVFPPSQWGAWGQALKKSALLQPRSQSHVPALRWTSSSFRLGGNAVHSRVRSRDPLNFLVAVD